MSVPFTTLERGTNLQTMHPPPFNTLPENATVLDELYLAFVERSLAIGPDYGMDEWLNSFFAAKNNIQTYYQNPWWEFLLSYMQRRMISDVYINYVNHTDPYVPEGDINWFDVGTFMSIAGLSATPDYFRNIIPTWTGFGTPVFNYATITNGDIINTWQFEEVQKTLSTLRWTSPDGEHIVVNDFTNQNS